MANRYWFARRFPVGEPGDRMDPVSREGWIVVWSFAAALVVGFLSLLVFTIVFQKPMIGFIIMLVLASLGMSALLMLSRQRGDQRHTAAEYKAGTVIKR
jgi:hypothetical protein